MLQKFLKFITWPAIAGLLAAVIILQWFAPFKPPAAGSAQDSYAAAVEQAAPSVVNILAARLPAQRHPLYNDPVYGRFYSRERVQRSLGSGVIVDRDGLIMTNQHVIANADQILVQLHDGREHIAEVIGSDDDTDLALLRIEANDLRPIVLGDPDKARVGDVVLAIGNPYGFGHSVSQGIISALGRYGLQLTRYEDFIQTDAAINLGNSGGALIDTRGRLLGINTATFSQRGGDALGIGLATPSDLAMSVMQDLLSYGRVIRGWMGLEVRVINPDPDTPALELLQVSGIDARGPAARAGISLGDFITHINGQTVRSGRLTMHQIAMLRPGELITIGVVREGKPLTLEAMVGVRPETGDGSPR